MPVTFFGQRLSSSGYVFSASLPPYLASAAITAIDVLEENAGLTTKLKKNIATLWKGCFSLSCLVSCHGSYNYKKYCPSFAGLSGIQGLVIASHPASPVVFLQLKKSTGSSKGDLQLLEDISHRVSFHS